jgi:hypothetical protein
MGIGWDWLGEIVRLCVNLCLLLDNDICLLLDNDVCLLLDNDLCHLLDNNIGLQWDCLLLDITPCGHILLNWDIM